MVGPRILRERPPVYDLIVDKLGEPPPTVVYAYRDTIYAPGLHWKHELPPDLVVHECVHLEQQASIGADEWWVRYVDDPMFRLQQEVEAYRAQIASHSDRPSRRECKRRVARDLASGLYGRLVSGDEALRLLAVAR